MRPWFSTWDVRHEPLLGSICNDNLCVEQGDQHGSLPGRRTQALSIHQHHATITNTCYIMCNRTQKTLKIVVKWDWWPLVECLLTAFSLPTLMLQRGLKRPRGDQAPSQTRSVSSQSIQGVQQHFKTCLRGSGKEATDCKVLAGRNGCLDTEPSSISLKRIHSCNFIWDSEKLKKCSMSQSQGEQQPIWLKSKQAINRVATYSVPWRHQLTWLALASSLRDARCELYHSHSLALSVCIFSM